MPRFGKDVLGQAQWSFLQLSPRVAHIYGTKGSITVERTNCPERLTLKPNHGQTKVKPLLCSSRSDHKTAGVAPHHHRHAAATT